MSKRINRLNNLTNSEWLRSTSSVWWNKENSEERARHAEVGQFDLSLPTFVLSSPQPPDELKRLHPATYAESDIKRFISFFTKKGETVLDPFLGSGSTALACLQTSRNCIGIELFRPWVSLTKKRIVKAYAAHVTKIKRSNLLDLSVELNSGLHCRLLCGDSRTRLKHLDRESVDFVLTSPPYWNILTKDADKKIKHTRRKLRLPTNYGHSASNLGEVPTYSAFMSELREVFNDCAQVLRNGKYMCIIVGDFRHGKRFYPFHSNVIDVVEACGLSLEGITIIAHNSKHLYPYGMPYAFVSNIHHSYALIFRKRLADESGDVQAAKEKTRPVRSREAYIV